MTPLTDRERRRIDRSVAMERFCAWHTTWNDRHPGEAPPDLIDAFLAGWDDVDGHAEAARRMIGGDVCPDCLDTGLRLVNLHAPWNPDGGLRYIDCPRGCKPHIVPLWSKMPRYEPS